MHKKIIGTGNWYRLAKTGHSYVVDTLGHEIVTGKIAVGSIMAGDAKLIERFRVSRTVLREVMKTLGAKGLIVARARIGTRVNEKIHWNMFDRDVLRWHLIGTVSPDFISQIFEVRRALEPLAATHAAEHAKPFEIEELAHLAEQMGNRDFNIEDFVRIKLDFHLRLLECGRNPFMSSMGNVVEASLVPMFRMGSYLPDVNMRQSLAVSCQAIVETIRKRSAEGARLKTVAHIDMCQHFFISNMNSDPKRISVDRIA